MSQWQHTFKWKYLGTSIVFDEAWAEGCSQMSSESNGIEICVAAQILCSIWDINYV